MPDPVVVAEVLDLIAASGRLLDTGEFEAWSRLWTVDGQFRVFGQVMTGQAELQAFGELSPKGVHVAGLPGITEQDGEVRATTSFVFVNSQDPVPSAGYYRDTFVRVDGRLLFSVRAVRVHTEPGATP